MTKDEFMRVNMKRERGDESAGEVDPFNGILIKWDRNMQKNRFVFFQIMCFASPLKEEGGSIQRQRTEPGGGGAATGGAGSGGNQVQESAIIF